MRVGQEGEGESISYIFCTSKLCLIYRCVPTVSHFNHNHVFVTPVLLIVKEHKFYSGWHDVGITLFSSWLNFQDLNFFEFCFKQFFRRDRAHTDIENG